MPTADAFLFLTGLPARRNLPQLREALSTLVAGTVVRAAFKSERYGVFVIEGTVRQGIGGDLGVGGHFLGTATRVDSDLIGIIAGVPSPELPETVDAADAAALAHGDIVTAHVQHDVHGLLALTGPVTESDHDRFRLLGSWIITDGDALAPRIAAVERHAGPEDTLLAAPSRRRHQDAGSAVLQ